MAKTASLVHFYFGEASYMNRLAQETVPLSLALEGYDRSVLLHHETNVGPFQVSKSDEKHADVVDIPTAANLVQQLNDLRKSGHQVDVYVFSHGYTDRFLVSRGTYGDNALIRSAYIEEHVQPLNLRAVWQCNCYGASLNAMWRRLGAKASAGSRFVNFYPTRFSGFAKAWADGQTFGQALTSSNTAAVRSAVQAYMMVDAGMRLKEWGGNIFQAPTVLGKNASAEKYFRECWLQDDYDPAKSGKQNMNYASAMMVSGNRSVLR